MKKLVVLLLVSMMATSAFAVADPDPDMLGIYFDMTGDVNCISAGLNQSFFAYLLLTNSTTATVEACEFSYHNVFPDGATLYKLNTTLPEGAVDVGGGDAVSGAHAYGLAAPIPCNGATVMVTWQYLPLFDGLIEMFIGPFTTPSIPGADLPIVQTLGVLRTVGYSTGGPDIPSATVNGDCPVAVDSETWGSLKSLYR